MSFMGAFGSSFSDSFNASVARSENQKNDMLRMGYADFIDRSKERREKEQKASQEVKSAKAFAKSMGLPEGAFNNVIEWRDAGYSNDEIIQMTQKAVWGGTQNADTTQNAASVGQGGQIVDARDSVSSQMQGSGLAPAAQKVQQQQTPNLTQQNKQAPNSRPGLLGSLSGIFDKKSPEEKQKATTDRNIQQIAKHTGRTEEEVRNTMMNTEGPNQTERNRQGLQVSGIDPTASIKALQKGEGGDDLSSEGKAIDSYVRAQAAYEADPTADNKARVDKAQRVLAIHAERSTETLRNK